MLTPPVAKRPPTIVSAPHYVESLLAQCSGYAAVANTTGGAAGPIVPVTNFNLSGPGSFPAALAVVGPKWITGTVRGTLNYRTLGILNIPGDTTIDMRGDFTLDGQGLDQTGPNVIVNNVKFAGTQTNSFSADCISNLGGFDKFWIHHCTMADAHEDCFVVFKWRSNLCRGTLSDCYFGPQPGPAGLAWGVTSAETVLIGNNSATNLGYDLVSQGLFTIARCMFEVGAERNPGVFHGSVHLYGSAITKWGDWGGLGYGSGNTGPIAGSNNPVSAEMRIEGNVYRPFLPNEWHPVHQRPVVRPSLEAIIRRPGEGGAGMKIYENNNLLMYGAQVGLETAVTGRPRVLTPSGFPALEVGQAHDFKDDVFIPPYAYDAPKPGPELIDRLRLTAGWHDVPPPF